MYSTTAELCPKATSETKPKPDTLGKGASYQATAILGKKWHILGHRPFCPSATEAASLKVSIKQGFYLKMYCSHSPLWCYKPWLSLSPVWPCTALCVWPPYTEITSTLSSSRREHSSLMSTLEKFQVLGKQKLQDQQSLCQVMSCHWSIPTWTFLAYYCSLERHSISTSFWITQLWKSLHFLGSFWV